MLTRFPESHLFQRYEDHSQCPVAALDTKYLSRDVVGVVCPFPFGSYEAHMCKCPVL